MIRLIDDSGNPFWVNPKRIDSIQYSRSFERVELYYHSGGSCITRAMAGSVDDVKKMLDEARLK